MKTVKVTVTKKNWDDGHAAALAGGRHSRCCAVAQALDDAGVKFAGVGYGMLSLDELGFHSLVMPTAAVDVVMAFEKPQSYPTPEFPVEFELAVPASAVYDPEHAPRPAVRS